MKKQILTLIIGILIGAIITTGVFLALKGNSGGQGNRMNREGMPSMDGSSSEGKRPSQQGNDKNNETEDNDGISNDNNVSETDN